MKRLILIISGLVFLSSCSGVKQFAVEDFGDAVRKICTTERTINITVRNDGVSNVKKIKAQINPVDVVNGVVDVAVANSKTGCSANITPTTCSVSCGGSDTPKIESKQDKG